MALDDHDFSEMVRQFDVRLHFKDQAGDEKSPPYIPRLMDLLTEDTVQRVGLLTWSIKSNVREKTLEQARFLQAVLARVLQKLRWDLLLAQATQSGEFVVGGQDQVDLFLRELGFEA
ncbi:MAG: hypothetical protein WCT36_04295, partial [Candidatus Gracilibacteria bacterium]